MKEWNQLADKEVVKKTMESLRKSSIESFFVETGDEAKRKVLDILPKGAEVMTMSSVTLDSAGISNEINESENYDSVRKKLK